MAIIKMIKNPPKTKVSLKKAINYITQPGKTRPDLVGGLNCDWVRAYNEFCEVKSQFEKEDGIQAKHFVMSFDVKDNVSVETAKQIADELLKNKLFTNFQVVYAVHKDKDHIHTHFLINSVSFENGKRWHQTAEDLRNLKAFSNEICKSHGLSEMDFNKNAGSLSDIEYQNRFESWKYELYLAVLNSSYRAGNKEDFINILDNIGYKVNWEDNKKYITFTTPDGKKCRNRNIYPRYKFTKEALEKQFEHNVCNIDKNKMLKSQENFIQKVTAQTDVKYPISFIVESEEKQRSMTYNQWYEQNKEYLINDDKYDTYKCIGFAIKNSTNEKEFIDRINRMGLKVEFDRESNVTIFTSKQGIEYGNYEMYQGEKYSPKELLNIFLLNQKRKNFYKEYFNCLKQSNSKEELEKLLKKCGYTSEQIDNEYNIFIDGELITNISLQKVSDNIFNSISYRYLSEKLWESENVGVFFKKINEDEHNIWVDDDKVIYAFNEKKYSNKNFDTDKLKEHFVIKEFFKAYRESLWENKDMNSLSSELKSKGYVLEKNQEEYNVLKEGEVDVIYKMKIDKVENDIFEISSYKYLFEKIKEAENIQEFIKNLSFEGNSLKKINDKIVYTINGKQYENDNFNTINIEKKFNIKDLYKEYFNCLKQSDDIEMLKHELEKKYDLQYNTKTLCFEIYLKGKEEKLTDMSVEKIGDNFFNKDSFKLLLSCMWMSDSVNDFMENLIDRDVTVDEDENGLYYKICEKEYRNEVFDNERLNEYFFLKQEKKELIEVLRIAKYHSKSMKEFCNNLEKLGYSVISTENNEITYRTPNNTVISNGDLFLGKYFTREKLEEQFFNNRIDNNFNNICSFLHIFMSDNSMPVSSAISLVGDKDLSGEKLREFLYHFERGTASIYNRNLYDGLSI